MKHFYVLSFINESLKHISRTCSIIYGSSPVIVEQAFLPFCQNNLWGMFQKVESNLIIEWLSASYESNAMVPKQATFLLKGFIHVRKLASRADRKNQLKEIGTNY